MGKKLTKKQRAQIRKKRNEKKIKKLEKQDAKGISRKKLKNAIRPEIFVILKIISIILIPVFYFIYSPLLIVGIIFVISMFIFAKKAENYINHSFIKSNHIKINKIDSVLASIVLIITIAGTFLGGGGAHHSQQSTWFSIKMKLENTASCLTGRRSFITSTHKMEFGTADVPADLPRKGEHKKMEMSDLPLEAIFSMMLSSVNSVMIFLVPISGSVSLLIYYVKRHRFDEKMNEIITDDFKALTDEDYDRIFTFDMVEVKEDETDFSIEYHDNE